ncbi:anti-sigma factor family protein [Vallitalea guaymasensis]|uniref:anti-sigma factor family protein n=1 Tax=Vallitalea guaymasensis TaxID=1185412 RepID=UPI00272D9C94|nr:zf-HC2 domain-containing protein [Vallitalea guaymasensis]
MDCSKVQEMMSLYIDDQLSKEERKLFEEHIASCEQCKEELDFLQTMINNVNDINEEKELPTDFHKNLMVKIDSTNLTDIQAENRINRLNRFTKYYTAVAAVFVIVLVFGFIGKTNINRITDDKLQYDVNTESIKEDSMDKDIRDEATKEAAPVKQIATSDHDKEAAPKEEFGSKSFKDDPVAKNESKSDETAITEDDLGTFEFQEAENGERISESANRSEKSENPDLYKENIEPDNGIQGITKDDNADLKDEKSNKMDKNIKDEATKETTPVKQIPTSDYGDKEATPKEELGSKSFKNEPGAKNENGSDEATTTEDDLDTFEFQAAENGDGVSEGVNGSEENSENPALSKENIEPDNGIQGITKDDKADLIDDEPNNMDKDNKQLDKGEQIDTEFSESKSNNSPTVTFDSQVEITTTESEPESNKSNNEWNTEWIIIIGIIIILIIPLIYIKIQKNKLNR